MIIRQMCVYLLMVSGMLLFAGCYIMADRPQGEAQLDSTTLGAQSKNLTGPYRDVGSDGSIKPHPHPSYIMSQEPDRTTGEMTIGAGEVPDMKMSTINKSTGGTMPRSGSGSNSAGSSSGASGAGRR